MSTCYIWGPMAPVREIEMGGGGRVRQTDGTEMVGGGGGQTARKREWIDKRQRVGHRETKRETDGHTTETACINIHHHPHQTPSQTPRA